MGGYRHKRLADVLMSFIGQELRRMSDPRLEFVTITEIRVTSDLRVATIFWTIPTLQQVPTTSTGGAGTTEEAPTILLGDPTAKPDEERIHDVAEALKRTVYAFKKKIAKELHLRYTPDLIFTFDDSPSNAVRIEQLLKRVGY